MPVPSGTMQVRCVTTLDELVVISNTFYAECASPPANQAAIQAAADAAFTAISPLYTAIMSSEDMFQLVQMTYTAGGTELQAFSAHAGVAGDLDVSSMGPSDALIVRRVTGNTGRDQRGRVFIAPLGETVVDEGTVAVDFFPAVKAIASHFGADRTYGALTLHWRLWDRKTNALIPVTMCRAINKISSRRDRRRRLPALPIS